jgi:hypothetical protein
VSLGTEASSATRPPDPACGAVAGAGAWGAVSASTTGRDEVSSGG